MTTTSLQHAIESIITRHAAALAAELAAVLAGAVEGGVPGHGGHKNAAAARQARYRARKAAEQQQQQVTPSVTPGVTRDVTSDAQRVTRVMPSASRVTSPGVTKVTPDPDPGGVTKVTPSVTPGVTKRHKVTPGAPLSDSPPSSSSLESLQNDDDDDDRDSTVTRVTRVTPPPSRVTPPAHDAESEAFETDPANDPERIIASWVGHELSLREGERLDRIVVALQAEPPARIGAREAVSRLELFVRAMLYMRDQGKPYASLTATVNYCNAVVATCVRDHVMPGEWPEGKANGKPKGGRTNELEAKTKWH